MTRLRARHVVASALAVATASMWLAPTTLNFDPWGWLIWGREIVSGDLDTTGGPSWKPFPVLVTVPLSWLGDRAPVWWMVLARTAGLLMLVTVALLTCRLAGTAVRRRTVVVGAVAATAFAVFTPDPEPRWFRTVLEGHSAPIAATLTTFAVERHLAGRVRWAWAAVVAAALIRPEVWPFLGIYGLWLLWVRRERPGTIRTAAVVASWVGVAVAWFGGDYWGSGSFWHGADVAQVGPSSLSQRWSLVVDVTTEMVAPIVWLAAAVTVVGVARRWRRGPSRTDRAVAATFGLAAAWVGIVAVLTLALGYAAISRFLLPAACLVCVVAGLGVATAFDAVPSAEQHTIRGGTVLAIAALVVSTPRVLGMADVWDEVISRGERSEDLERAVDAAVAVTGRDALLACGEPVITEAGLRAHLAWALDVPMHATGARRTPPPGPVAFVRVGDVQPVGPVAAPMIQIAETEHWRVVAFGCDIFGSPASD